MGGGGAVVSIITSYSIVFYFIDIAILLLFSYSDIRGLVKLKKSEKNSDYLHPIHPLP